MSTTSWLAYALTGVDRLAVEAEDAERGEQGRDREDERHDRGDDRAERDEQDQERQRDRQPERGVETAVDELLDVVVGEDRRRGRGSAGPGERPGARRGRPARSRGAGAPGPPRPGPRPGCGRPSGQARRAPPRPERAAGRPRWRTSATLAPSTVEVCAPSFARTSSRDAVAAGSSMVPVDVPTMNSVWCVVSVVPEALKTSYACCDSNVVSSWPLDVDGLRGPRAPGRDARHEEADRQDEPEREHRPPMARAPHRDADGPRFARARRAGGVSSHRAWLRRAWTTGSRPAQTRSTAIATEPPPPRHRVARP